jgi:hypothetical protein
MSAYRRARAWINETPAADIATAEQPFFPDVEAAVLSQTIAFYQQLGTWSPHVEITEAAYDVTLDVFSHSGQLSGRPSYAEVVAPPPGG